MIGHVLIAYEGVLLILGIISLILILVSINGKIYLKPFFGFFLVFTIVIFSDFLRSYFIINISWTSLFCIYISLGFSLVLNYLYIGFGIYTVYRLTNTSNKKAEITIILISAISAIITPLGITYIDELHSLSIRGLYYLSTLIYMSLLFYMLLILIFGLKNIKLSEDRILAIFFLILIVFGIIETAIYFFGIMINPIQKINSLHAVISFSSLAYILLSIYVIFFLLKRLTNKNDLPDKEKLNSLGYSPREIEVLYLIIEGYSNQKIADNLCVTLSTIKTHINNIFKKAQVSNRFELAKTLENL